MSGIIKIVGENPDGTFDVDVKTSDPEYIKLKHAYMSEHGDMTDEEFCQMFIEQALKDMIKMADEDPERFGRIMKDASL